MLKGSSFLRKDGDDDSSHGEPIKHLRFVISDPDPDDSVMVVNMTTYRGTGREDESCILNVGDHPFIKQKSYIVYKFAEAFNCMKLVSERFKGCIIPKENVEQHILKRIQEGAKKSPLLPPAFQKYFRHF